ncbi:sn-glycerol-1-phosphate dehydrogenase [Tabrizicola sp.]|uniref:sn-glycerol-1-phosphate dehydrogenase n=1 Tax=Tabrizicola sp. TaxID=2005166 RepID=UPI003F35F37F
MTDPIASAVARSTSVAEVAIGRGVLAQTGAIYRRRFGPGDACIIADENTWTAAGEATEKALAAAGIVTRTHILPARPRPKPTVELATALRDVLEEDDAIPVAVGSGVINDLVKHAAFALGRDYLCVATAASMDGYTSAGAPLSERGFKKTIPCRPAKALIADLDIICAAPREMTGWGYGDLAGKVPAGGDWMIADALGIEPIDDIAWPMVQNGLQGWLAHPEKIAAADPAAIEGLFQGLTLVGLAMEAHGSSRPASGADHQIAHLWEMDDLTLGGERVSHGACVAVGCVTTLRLYDWLLATPRRFDPDKPTLTMAMKAIEIRARFGPGEIADRAIAETEAKHVEGSALRARLQLLNQVWPDLALRLRARLMPATTMARALNTAGAPSEAAHIGVSRDYLHQTILKARFLRSRYTLLDLLDETGLLLQAAEAGIPQQVET